MANKAIVPQMLPKAMRELDRWDGKRNWPLFCERVAGGRSRAITAPSTPSTTRMGGLRIRIATGLIRIRRGIGIVSIGPPIPYER
jgi:hypothetical protein